MELHQDLRMARHTFLPTPIFLHSPSRGVPHYKHPPTFHGRVHSDLSMLLTGSMIHHPFQYPCALPSKFEPAHSYLHDIRQAQELKHRHRHLHAGCMATRLHTQECTILCYHIFLSGRDANADNPTNPGSARYNPGKMIQPLNPVYALHYDNSHNIDSKQVVLHAQNRTRGLDHTILSIAVVLLRKQSNVWEQALF